MRLKQTAAAAVSVYLFVVCLAHRLCYFRYLHPGSIPVAPYQGNRTYPAFIAGQGYEFIHATFLTNGSALCLDVANPIYGTWFAVAYLMQQKRDEAITVSDVESSCSMFTYGINITNVLRSNNACT